MRRAANEEVKLREKTRQQRCCRVRDYSATAFLRLRNL
ncbi:hypothetical protein CSC12_3864 [Klebsiella michiganensis]|nr:hypothetical protein CSC12_3864 [Klebsiella michiganensis]